MISSRKIRILMTSSIDADDIGDVIHGATLFGGSAAAHDWLPQDGATVLWLADSRD